MTLMSNLAEAQGGNYFASAAKACGMTASNAKSALDRLCPAIAVHLKSKVQSDTEAFEELLDLLDDGVDGNELDALTDAEAISDGNAVLKDLYGSPSAAQDDAAQAADKNAIA